MFCSKRCLLVKLVSNFPLDVNECEQIVGGLVSKGGCQHKCSNTIGSFICSCNPGFALTYDARTCEGINKHLKFVLFHL